MKKITTIILAVATLLALGSCATKNELDDLKNRVDKIENQTIKSIDDQISTIVGSFIYF